MSILRDLWEGLSDTAKHVLDALSFITVLGTVVKMLPALAAILSIVWTLLRIYESKTVQSLLARRRADKLMQQAWRADVNEPLSEAERDLLNKLK
jgi:hypothetical protein